jgi:hypothetical protein
MFLLIAYIDLVLVHRRYPPWKKYKYQFGKIQQSEKKNTARTFAIISGSLRYRTFFSALIRITGWSDQIKSYLSVR